MKNPRRFKLLLTPILISVLSLLMIVTTFSWYKVASGNTSLDPNSSNVSISTDGLVGLDVQIISLGDKCEAKYGVDNYYYDSANKTYTITKNNTVGYFGQTGLGSLDLNNNDKPYIRFYQADITSNKVQGIDVTKAFINYVKITKANEVLVETIPDWTEQTSEFSIDFYDCTQRALDGNKTELVFSNPKETFLTLESGKIVNKMTVYFGIKFFKRGSTTEFAYTDFLQFFKSTFSLKITFI